MTTDVLGEPIATLSLREPVTGVEAFLAIDTLPDGGPTTGGVRMMPTVTAAEVRRLARAMTFKYGISGVPCGIASARSIAPGFRPRFVSYRVRPASRPTRTSSCRRRSRTPSARRTSAVCARVSSSKGRTCRSPTPPKACCTRAGVVVVPDFVANAGAAAG